MKTAPSENQHTEPFGKQDTKSCCEPHPNQHVNHPPYQHADQRTIRSAQLYTYCGKWVSSVTRFITRIPIPTQLRQPILSAVTTGLRIQMNEAEKPIRDYPTINALFTRSLKPQYRPIALDAVVSPCDGTVLAYGKIEDAHLIQAKQIRYRIQDLLLNETLADSFASGSFITLYLSPSDCHQVRSPATGTIVSSSHIPGALYPVREPYISQFPGLYTRNERLISLIQTPETTLAVVLVAAINVGCMTLEYPHNLTYKKSHPSTDNHAPVPISAGAHLGTFHLGSTVVLLSRDPLTFTSQVTPKSSVRYGQALANISK